MDDRCDICNSEEEVEGGVCAQCFLEMPMDDWVSIAVYRSDKLEEKDA